MNKPLKINGLEKTFSIIPEVKMFTKETEVKKVKELIDKLKNKEDRRKL
jgi:hypothetical protein